MQYQIVLDVGGTGIKGILCCGRKRVTEVKQYPSLSDASCELIIDHLCNICDDLMGTSTDNNCECTHILAAFPGPFNYVEGIPLMKGLAKYESIYGICLPQAMKQCWEQRNNHSYRQTSWSFLNDVSAYAIGAVDHYGLHGRTMCVCIGTGAGSAFVIDQQLCIDTQEGVPENGWIYPIPFEGTTIDDVLSARGITQIAKSYCKRTLTPLQLSEEALVGKQEAKLAWHRFGVLLDKGLMPLVSQFRADNVVIGGKIALSAELFIQDFKRNCNNHGVRLIVEPQTTQMAIRGLQL